MIGWLVIYILAIPIFSFFIPVYSFWKMVRAWKPQAAVKADPYSKDDFSWGNTRLVSGERGKRKPLDVCALD